MSLDPRFWAGRDVCVTGGSGFLGFHLVQQLLALGARVRVLTFPSPAPNHPLRAFARVELITGDVRDPDAVRRCVAGCSVVFHTAGIVAFWGPSVARMWSVHEDGTRAVLQAAAWARVVHTSSMVTIGATRDGNPLDEDTPFDLDRLDLPYVHAKRAAECLALQAAHAGQDVVVVNPACLVGPEDHEGSVMGRLCVRFWKGRVLLAPPGGINLVDVRDAARGHLLAAQHGRSGRRYILGGEDHFFTSFLGSLSRAAGFAPRLLTRLPGWALTAVAALAESRSWWTGKEPYPSLAHARMNRLCWFVHSGRARDELGYVARPLDETLADTLAWYRQQHAVSLRGFNRWWMRPHDLVAPASSVEAAGYVSASAGSLGPSRLDPIEA
jgi:dihydroflavonol-4-reductase